MRCGPLVAKYIHTDCLMEEAQGDTYYDLICQLDEDGVGMVGMQNAFTELGLYQVNAIGNCSKECLTKMLKEDSIVIAVAYLEGAGRDDGHWSTVESFSEDESLIELYDPDLGHNRFMPWEHFNITWYDYESDYTLVPRPTVIGYTVEVEWQNN